MTKPTILPYAVAWSSSGRYHLSVRSVALFTIYHIPDLDVNNFLQFAVFSKRALVD